ncbi:type II toxin-antitoxin system VapC family toxin [Thiolinea disciformis]|uniref:type II toxin-antitoxin system VapC family toxin n=1 Tax=Thiolinea disciformis TaxID=125614 RepID=UPI0003776569|nr:type II toxin-antitoxin system VapC family toxin [Thiolinea disciformis]
MNLFFDTSALVKFFHQEMGSEQVIALIEKPENDIWVSDLARIEFNSALYRKFRRGDLDAVQLVEIASGFQEEWQNLNVQPVSQAVLDEAEALMQRQGKQLGLRTLDAIQLASFALLAEENWAFVVADGLLADAVEAEQLAVAL